MVVNNNPSRIRLAEESKGRLFLLLGASALFRLRTSRISAADSSEHLYVEAKDLKSETCFNCHHEKEDARLDVEPDSLSAHSSQTELMLSPAIGAEGPRQIDSPAGHLLPPATETGGIAKTRLGYRSDFLGVNEGSWGAPVFQGPLHGRRSSSQSAGLWNAAIFQGPLHGERL